MEEMSLRLRLRVLWLREGDKYIKFFHQVANTNRINNSVEFLLINVAISLDHIEIREQIAQFYNSLFTKQFNWWPNLVVFSFESIGEVEVIWLGAFE